jgi:phytoene dehydrogenase-like protein
LLTESCTDFVGSLEERYKKLGGEVTYNATVQEIIVENDCAVGVRLADGRELRADEVVSTGDGHSTIYRLLGGRYVDQKLAARYQDWKLISPIVTLSYGVACEFPQEPPLNFLLLKTPLLVGDVSLTGFPIRIFNYGGPFAPKGKTVVQALLHTDWNWWNELQKDRPRYDAAKKKIGEEVLARLEPHYPGLTANVEVTDVATPYTTWRYTLNREGAFMGWIPTPVAMRTQMRKTLPGLANFFMAGQWTVPGGGVPPCLYSGRHVIQILCRRDGKKFTASVP